jgi:hypothetical protein
VIDGCTHSASVVCDKTRRGLIDHRH